MSSLPTLSANAAETRNSVSLQQARDGRPETDARRGVSLMRKYDIAALMPDLTVVSRQHVAPASPLFEETATAFARGTLIQTVGGPVAIEDLMPGDYVQTPNGTEPVMWIGSTSYLPGTDPALTTLSHLTRITMGAFGDAGPEVDILVGPAARMVVRRDRLRQLIGQDSVLAPVKDFDDGDRIVTVTPGGAVQLFHIMLKRHATIRIGGVEMETYHPGKSGNGAIGQNMRALFLSLFPHLDRMEDFGDLTRPRTTREVIDSLTG